MVACGGCQSLSVVIGSCCCECFCWWWLPASGDRWSWMAVVASGDCWLRLLEVVGDGDCQLLSVVIEGCGCEDDCSWLSLLCWQ